MNLFKDSNEYVKPLTLRLRNKIKSQFKAQLGMMVAAVVLLILLIAQELYFNIGYTTSLVGKELNLFLHISVCAVVIVYTRVMLPILDFDLDRVLEKIKHYKNGHNQPSPILKKGPSIVIENSNLHDINLKIENTHPMDVTLDAGNTTHNTNFTIQVQDSVPKILNPAIFVNIVDTSFDTPTTIATPKAPPSVNGSNSALSPNGTAIMPKKVQFSPSITTILD